MKLAIWAYSTAVTLTALLTVALGGLFQNIFGYMLGGKPLPLLTDFFLHLQWWVLLAALPYIGTATWLTYRPTLTIHRTVAFAGLSTLAIVFLLSLAFVSLCLPLLPITVSLQ
ncbi:MAG: hypothetical protein M3463_18210 [Verrucomicrobiota bacterium]|nr:hypothetical protein [Verrucomicrobiota bacterium]